MTEDIYCDQVWMGVVEAKKVWSYYCARRGTRKCLGLSE